MYAYIHSAFSLIFALPNELTHRFALSLFRAAHVFVHTLRIQYSKIISLALS